MWCPQTNFYFSLVYLFLPYVYHMYFLRALWRFCAGIFLSCAIKNKTSLVFYTEITHQHEFFYPFLSLFNNKEEKAEKKLDEQIYAGKFRCLQVEN